MVFARHASRLCDLGIGYMVNGRMLCPRCLLEVGQSEARPVSAIGPRSRTNSRISLSNVAVCNEPSRFENLGLEDPRVEGSGH